MRHTLVEQFRREEEATKTLMTKVFLSSGYLLATVLLVVFVAGTFILMR